MPCTLRAARNASGDRRHLEEEQRPDDVDENAEDAGVDHRVQSGISRRSGRIDGGCDRLKHLNFEPRYHANDNGDDDHQYDIINRLAEPALKQPACSVEQQAGQGNRHQCQHDVERELRKQHDHKADAGRKAREQLEQDDCLRCDHPDRKSVV